MNIFGTFAFFNSMVVFTFLKVGSAGKTNIEIELGLSETEYGILAVSGMTFIYASISLFSVIISKIIMLIYIRDS